VHGDPRTGRARSSAPVLSYTPAPDDAAQNLPRNGRVTGVLRRLGCLVASAHVHVRPREPSVHYAGLIPMAVPGRP